MKCSACRERLPAYQDGVLAAGAAADLEAHLASCVGCRTFSEEMMVVEHRLARLTEIEPRVDFTSVVMARIAAMPAPARRQLRMWWLGAYNMIVWALAGRAHGHRSAALESGRRRHRRGVRQDGAVGERALPRRRPLPPVHLCARRRHHRRRGLSDRARCRVALSGRHAHGLVRSPNRMKSTMTQARSTAGRLAVLAALLALVTARHTSRSARLVHRFQQRHGRLRRPAPGDQRRSGDRAATWS